MVWLMLVVLWLTWTPGRDSPPEILLRPPRMDLRAVLGNLMLFAPIGAVIAASRAYSRSPTPRELPRELLVVGMSAAFLSLVVEIGQLRVPGRHVTPYGVALNSMGAVAAAWLAYRVMRSTISPRTVVALAGTTTFVGVLLFVSATGYASGRMAIFSSWHAGYGVLVGDEFGGGRAYQGEISGAEICGGPGDDEVCVRAGADQEERQALVDAVQNEQLIRLSAWVTSFGSQTERDSRLPPRSLQFATLVAVAAFSLPLGLLAVYWTAPHLAVRILVAGALPVVVFIPLAAALVVPTPTEELVACTAFGLIGGILGSLGGALHWLGHPP